MKKSDSGLSRPTNSRPRTPKGHRNDREFILWIPKPLEDLENLIQSKQRTLDLLNFKTETLEKEIEDQLLSRDRYIYELSKQVQELRTSIKSRDSGRGERNIEKELDNQEMTLSQLRRENKDLLHKLRALEDEFLDVSQKWEIEKDRLENENNELEETGEGLKGKIEAKELEITEKISVITNMQTTVGKFTRLNSDLLGNVDKMNSEIKILNTKLHESNLKAARVPELEAAVEEYTQQNFEKDTKNAKLLMIPDVFSKFLKVTDWVASNLEVIEEQAKIREKSLAHSKEESIQKELLDLKLFIGDTIANVGTIQASLKNSTPSISLDDQTTELVLRKKNIEIEQEIQQIKYLTSGIQTREKVYIENIEKLQELLDRFNEDYQSSLTKMKGQFDVLKELNDNANKKLEKINEENEKSLNEIIDLKSKLAHLNGKQEHFYKKRNDFHEIVERLESENALLREKIGFEASGNKKNSTAEELRIKKALFQLQILKEEVFRKDTEIVKRSREIVKFTKEIESEKTANQKLQGKMKTIEAEIISKVSQELEEKDRQIDILKEMLRCAHSDIKLKDQLIANKKGDRMTSPNRK